jgi:hypothetical protein
VVVTAGAPPVVVGREVAVVVLLPPGRRGVVVDDVVDVVVVACDGSGVVVRGRTVVSVTDGARARSVVVVDRGRGTVAVLESDAL